MSKFLLYYLIIINIVTFLVYGTDKWKARRSKWRIPEATLLGLAVIGGSIGAWSGTTGKRKQYDKEGEEMKRQNSESNVKFT